MELGSCGMNSASCPVCGSTAGAAPVASGLLALPLGVIRPPAAPAAACPSDGLVDSCWLIRESNCCKRSSPLGASAGGAPFFLCVRIASRLLSESVAIFRELKEFAQQGLPKPRPQRPDGQNMVRL